MIRSGWHRFTRSPSPKGCLVLASSRPRLPSPKQERQYSPGTGRDGDGDRGPRTNWTLLKKQTPSTPRSETTTTTPTPGTTMEDAIRTSPELPMRSRVDREAEAIEAMLAAAFGATIPDALKLAPISIKPKQRRKSKRRPSDSSIPWSQLEANAERNKDWNIGNTGLRNSNDSSGNWNLMHGTAATHNLSDSPEIHAESPQAKKSVSRGDQMNMLLFFGLSPNLAHSDFYRLGPSDLSGWAHTIRKVHQARDPKTLEPLGRFSVSFDNGEAASSYRDNITRRFKLACHRIASPTGLWQSTVPAQLCGPPSGEPSSQYAMLEAEAESYALSPPVHGSLTIRRRRLQNTRRRPWTKFLSILLEPHDLGPQPPTILLRVYPPGPTEDDVARMIREDGWQNDIPWRVSSPRSLKRLGSDSYSNRKAHAAARRLAEREDIVGVNLLPAEDPTEAGAVVGSTDELPSRPPTKSRRDELPKIEASSRFVFTCETDWEARRFHRGWNQRQVLVTSENGAATHVIQTSVVEW